MSLPLPPREWAKHSTAFDIDPPGKSAGRLFLADPAMTPVARCVRAKVSSRRLRCPAMRSLRVSEVGS